MSEVLTTKYQFPHSNRMPKVVDRYLDHFGIPRNLQRLSLHGHAWSKIPNVQQWGAAWSRGLIVNTAHPSYDIAWSGRGLFIQAQDPSLATTLMAGLVQDVLRLANTYTYTQGIQHTDLLRWFRAEDYHQRTRVAYSGEDKIDTKRLMDIPLVVVANVSGTDRYQCESVAQLVSNRRSEGLPTLVTGVDITETLESSAPLARLLRTCCVVTYPGDKSVVPFALAPTAHAG